MLTTKTEKLLRKIEQAIKFEGKRNFQMQTKEETTSQRRKP